MGKDMAIETPRSANFEDGQSDDEDKDDGMDTRGLVRKKKAMKDKICNRPTERKKKGDLHVGMHKKEKDQNAETRALLTKGIKENKFCKTLADDAVAAVVEIMEFYEFAKGDTVVKEGDNGSYFFVAQSGELKVSVGDKVVNSIGAGVAFGAIALLYDCPRTASVTAQEAAGVWGADGDVFREVLHEHAKTKVEANRKFLDQMSLFDGLTAKDKEMVGQLALLEESFEPGKRVVTQDEQPTAVYFVKEGELHFVDGGKIGASGKLEGGETIGALTTGDCFGWRGVFFGEKQRASVIADSKCELVCVGVKQMENVLGSDFAVMLGQSWVLSVLRQLPVISVLNRAQRQQVANAFETKKFAAGEKLPASTRFAIVADGDASVETASGKTVALKRGQWCQDGELQLLMHEEVVVDRARLDTLVAGSNGCRLALLPAERLASSLSAENTFTSSSVLDYLRKVILSKRVPIFKELSQSQVENLVAALVLKPYARDDKVFKQGENGNAFFVVASGEVTVDIDGKNVRTLGVNSSFGERALLFNEKRSATVFVSSEKAEMWSIDRDTFNSVVEGAMREALVHSMKLQNKAVTLKLLKHVRLIGAGSFGSVRLVEHKRTAMRYALKRIKKEGPNRDEVPDEVKSEIELLGRANHPFVLKLIASFESKHDIYILTDLVTGGQMYEKVEQMGVMNRKGAQFYVGSIVLMLEYLHEQNIVYRDLKPENVMLDSQGYCKLVDFGLAKLLPENSARTYTLCGTLFYMAPEVVRGHGYGFECDIWSLGCMAYELVCGAVPFGEDRDEDHEIFADILEQDLCFPSKYTDAAGKKLIKGMLERDVAQRDGVKGSNGWEEIKANHFFKKGVSGNLFNQISGREIVAPINCAAETYSDEAEMADMGCSLSDSEELGKDESADVGCRVLVAFKKFDLNGDGKIDTDELTKVLCALNPKVFTDKMISQIMAAADTDHNGQLDYEEFVAWVFSDQDMDLINAFKEVIELDIR